MGTPRQTANLEKYNDGADEHAEALEKISHHVDKGRSHAGIGLLSPPSWQEKNNRTLKLIIH